MFRQELAVATSRIREALQDLNLPIPERIEWMPVPFSGEWGYGSAACFQVAAADARRRGVDVSQRAGEICQAIVERLELPPGFSHVRAERGYINLTIDAATYAARVVDTILAEGPDFGRGGPKGERVMVEFAQPNTHHSFHIGHARNAILGEAVSRLVEFAGFETIRASYPGDIGLSVITVLWAYRKFYQGQEPEGVHERGQWLLKIYAEDETPEQAARRAEADQERRELLRRWDAGDPEVRELWRKTRQWSLDELNEVLRQLDIRIDVWFFESEVDKLTKEIVEELVERGVAEDDRPNGGPVIVRIDEKLGLAKERYRTAVLLRSDGTTLYLAKDLALAKVKFEEYKVDRSIYVVDVRQSLHFQQAFKILELWGFPQASKCHHLAYGFVSLPEGTMSSRRGQVVLFMDVVEEAVRRVKDIIAEKNPSLTGAERDEVARQVGLGAIKYAMLAVDNTKDLVFDWASALNFDGASAPYIQNAHVRAHSILRKAGELPAPTSFGYLLHPIEVELIDRLSRFPGIAEQAALQYKPLHMASYAFELARTFHAFYHALPVLKAEGEGVREARLRLTAATRQVVANSLGLLGIQAPPVM
jgi:arginyl-tRNA synthetase